MDERRLLGLSSWAAKRRGVGYSPALVFIVLAFLVLACGSAPPKPTPTPEPKQGERVESSVELELVESWPVETSLNNEAIADAVDVWLEMIEGAEQRIDFEEFYLMGPPEDMELPKVKAVFDAVEAAAARGVQIRLIVDAKLYKYNEAWPERWKELENIEVRIIDLSDSFGGVQHSKFFVVDGREAYFGSQNFDWRSLMHIQELGVRTSLPGVVAPLGEIFEADWARAGGSEAEVVGATKATDYPIRFGYGEEESELWFGASPEAGLSDKGMWDLPMLLERIGGAQREIRIQLLNYGTQNYDGSTFLDLDEALRAAADRGVQVKLTVADWAKGEHTLEAVQGLQGHPGVEVKFVTIPEWSQGFVDHSRVVHSKYMVVDCEVSWVGTSNWSGDYFLKSRNVGIFVEGKRFAQDLIELHEALWSSDYAYPVEVDRAYEAPRTH